MATTASPCVRSVTIPRCTTDRGWYVSCMAVRGNKLAVSGHNYMTDTSFIDLFTLNDPDSSSPLMTQLCSKLLDHPRWPSKCYVSFLDDSRVVAVYGDLVQVYHIEADDSKPSHTVNLLHDRESRCVTVSPREIFIVLPSNKVIVFDFSLNKIKTITLKGLEGDYPEDITVYGDNLFISTDPWRAIRYNMEGNIVHEYKTPGYSCARSITVSGLVYILWDYLHVVVYSLSDSQQLMSFDVDESHRIRIVDVNRLLTVDRDTGKVREYSMPPDVLTLLHESLQKVFAEMTRSDSENLANFFMFPLKHVKAIVNSASHSKDLLVELENKGIIQSALTDELCENLGALNILTGRSERRNSSINRSSSTFQKQQLTVGEEEGKGRYPSIHILSSAHLKQTTTVEEEGEGSESFLYRLSSTFLKQVKGTRPYRWLFQSRSRILTVEEEEEEEGKGRYPSIHIPSSAHLKQTTTVEEEDWKPPDAMEITSSISGKGGLLQIPNTGIKLVFPPNAVTEELNIQVKIIPPSLLNEPATSFSSNSSVVLELLPNGLLLKRKVSLTLPHCLTFINEEKAKAKVYVSHHEEGQRPRWEERPLSTYIFHRSKCTVRLHGFCWLKVKIDDTEVEAKNLVVFAAKKILRNKETAKVEVGYYEDIPECGEPNILKLNPDIKPERSLQLKFMKEGKQPLTISFNGTDPDDTWYTRQGKAKEEIPWQSIALSEERLVPFVLRRRENMDSFCNFSAQQGNHNPINFEIELEVDQSTGEIADSTVPDCILEHLARELSSEWEILARYLNISDGDLYNINENNPRCKESAKYFMLHQWRRRNGAGATCSVLATALDKAGRRDLREYVESQDLRDQQIEDREIKRKRAKHKHHKEKRKSTSPQTKRAKHRHHKVKRKSVSSQRKRAKQYQLDDREKEHQSEGDKAQASCSHEKEHQSTDEEDKAKPS